MQKDSNPKHPGNPGQNEKTKPMDNRYRRESKDSQLKGPVNIFNKIIEENSPNIKKEMPTNKKPTELQIDWTRKKFLPSHNNQNTKCTKQRKNIKSSKRKRSSNI